MTELQATLADGAQALHADGDLHASRHSFERAYRLAEQDGDADGMAVAALGLAGLWVSEWRTVTGAAQLEARLRQVLSLLTADSPLALRIRARLTAEADYGRGEHAAILAVLDEIRANGDQVLLAEALNVAHHCLLGPDHAELRRVLEAELVRTSFRTQRRGDLLMGLLWCTVDAYAEGDPHATRVLGELRDHLKERNHLAIGFVVSAIDVMLAIRAGHLDEAEALVDICGSDLAHLARSSSWLVTMNGIVEAAYLLQEADVAALAYDLLRPHADRPMIGSLGITCFGTTHHALGVAALTSGQVDLAIDHLRAAVKHNLVLAHWPAVLASRQRLAQAYALRGLSADVDAARRELDTAASEAAVLGLEVLNHPVCRPSSLVVECSRVGRRWRLSLRNRSVLVDDSMGMIHLAVLIANPRREIQAADLVAGLAALSGGSSVGAVAHPVLDREAIGDYRNRLDRLDAEIDQRESGGDHVRAASARAERDWLTAQLASAAGLGGRTRSFPDQGERARVAVGKAIRRALGRITEADGFIGEHLREAVHTGVRCSYWPG